MTRDPFLRLALIAAATAYFVAMLVAAELFGAWVLAAIPLGIAAAGALTVQFIDSPPDQDPRRRIRQPRDGTKGFERIP